MCSKEELLTRPVKSGRFFCPWMEMSTKKLLGALEFGPSHHRLGGQDRETLNRLRVSAIIPTISHRVSHGLCGCGSCVFENSIHQLWWSNIQSSFPAIKLPFWGIPHFQTNPFFVGYLRLAKIVYQQMFSTNVVFQLLVSWCNFWAIVKPLGNMKYMYGYILLISFAHNLWCRKYTVHIKLWDFTRMMRSWIICWGCFSCVFGWPTNEGKVHQWCALTNQHRC